MSVTALSLIDRFQTCGLRLPNTVLKLLLQRYVKESTASSKHVQEAVVEQGQQIFTHAVLARMTPAYRQDSSFHQKKNQTHQLAIMLEIMLKRVKEHH